MAATPAGSDSPCSSFSQIPEEVGLSWDPGSQGHPGRRLPQGRWRGAGTGAGGRRGRGAGGCGRAGGAQPPWPAAAGPVGLPAQPRAPAGPAVRRPLALLRPPRREPPLPPAPRPLPSGAQRRPRRRRGRLHAARLLRAPPHRRVSRGHPDPPLGAPRAGQSPGTPSPRHAPRDPRGEGPRAPPPPPRLPRFRCILGREIDDVISADLHALMVRGHRRGARRGGGPLGQR